MVSPCGDRLILVDVSLMIQQVMQSCVSTLAVHRANLGIDFKIKKAERLSQLF